MADRNVTVRLRAETSDFKRGMDQAAKSTEQVGKSAQSAASTARKEWTQWWPEVQKGDGIMKQLGKSFRENRAEWNQLAGGMMKAGGAMTAVTAGVLATGVAYNTLQQTSRAALTTMMGGAEAANAQMDKLDAFARNSPFAKQVFINAQRQLIGFGMEAEKVIPTLDAIQNAVAAVGGSNQDIAELTRIIAQVGAAGKITAVDLMQFGQRGVDAATLIGSQMGKTGAQIRDEITAGTLDADAAIDALVAGMQEKFGGAAAGVKDTFSGAVDRVKAAIRDLSSEFATFLVDPQGGGALIDWTNKFADALRAVQKLPEPIKETGGALFSLTGVALLATGASIKMVSSLMDMREAFVKISTDAPIAGRAIKGFGTVASALAIGVVANELSEFIANMTIAKVPVEDLAGSLERLGKGYQSSLDGLGRLMDNNLALKWLPWVNEVDTATEAIEAFGKQAELALGGGFTDKLERFLGNKSLHKFEERIRQLDAALADMVRDGNADAATDALNRLLSGVSPEIVDEVRAKFVEYNAALKQTDADARLAAGGVNRLSEVEQAAADAAQAAADAQDKFADAVLKAASAALEAANSEIAYESALDRATESIKDNGKTLDVNTEKGRANKSALLDIAAAAVRVAEDQLKAGMSTDEVGRSMDDARKKFIDTAEKMGATRAEAESMANQFGLTRGQVAALDRSLDDLPDVVRLRVEAATAQARADIANLQAAINNLKGKTVVIATQFSGPGAQYVRPGMVGMNADGGLWDKAGALGMVRAFRSGGFFDGKIGAQQPQIRPYSSPRGLLWSEEGSGPWEAFISGHPAKRDRSLRIWLDVGRRLGAIAAHAEGGLQEYRNAAVRAPSPVMPAAQPGAMEIAGTLDLGDGMTAALRGVADFTQMGGLRSRMAAGVRS